MSHLSLNSSSIKGFATFGRNLLNVRIVLLVRELFLPMSYIPSPVAVPLQFLRLELAGFSFRWRLFKQIFGFVLLALPFLCLNKHSSCDIVLYSLCLMISLLCFQINAPKVESPRWTQCFGLGCPGSSRAAAVPTALQQFPSAEDLVARYSSLFFFLVSYRLSL